MTSIEEFVVVDVTPMQRRVVGELALDGPDNALIAERLDLSVETVKTHLRNVMGAAGVPNRTALVCGLLRGQIKLRIADGRRPEGLSQRTVN